MPDAASESRPPGKIFRLHPNVFFLGLTSLLNDFSSELIFTLLPLFLTNILGASTVLIGLIGGISGSADALFRIASGWYSDKMKQRKVFAVAGYALSAFVRPFMLVAGSWGAVTGLRFTDRIGKGIRNAPRDALVADSVDKELRGRAFGIQRAMDTSGAVIGLAVAALIIYLVQGTDRAMELSTYRWMVIVGIIPGILCTLVILFMVKEGGKRADIKDSEGTAVKTGGVGLSRKFKIYLCIVGIFTLGNTSDMFVILRAQNLGNSLIYISLILVMFNLVSAVSAIPAGILSDRLGRRGMIITGWLVYSAVYLGFAVASAAWHIWLLFTAYGVYHGMVEGVSRAFVADLVPPEKRGTAYGWYNGVLSIALLPASLIAGWMWSAVSPAATFYLGAGLALLAAAGVWILLRD
ncbi:MAG: MFS transporter [Dehalococcoidales bacterium]|nr:MFS transporter [Dehalococcoidales bacterium]